VLHDEVEDPVVGATEVDDADARRMIEAARRTRLVVEARDRLLVAEQVGWMTLSATVRPSAFCTPRYTRPMPPTPISSWSRYAPPIVRPISGSPGLDGSSRSTLAPHTEQNRAASGDIVPHWWHRTRGA
jgi:hypothetical protein